MNRCLEEVGVVVERLGEVAAVAVAVHGVVMVDAAVAIRRRRQVQSSVGFIAGRGGDAGGCFGDVGLFVQRHVRGELADRHRCYARQRSRAGGGREVVVAGRC